MKSKFLVLDSRLTSVSLIDIPYVPATFGRRPTEYSPPTGIHLVLYGRDDRGQSVVAETLVHEGLSLKLLWPDSQDDDETLIELLFAEFRERRPLEFLPQYLEVEVKKMPCFYGFESSEGDPLVPRERRVVVLTTHELGMYRALRKIGEEVLHDWPLACRAHGLLRLSAIAPRGERGDE